MIYADYAATTPVHPSVLRAMEPYFSESFFNPSAIYPQGRQVQAALEGARRRVADYMGAKPEEIIFTGGGTEGDNLAIKGLALHPDNKKRHIITVQTEHHAVLESCRWLEQRGFAVTYLPVDRYGRVSAELLEQQINEDTFLISVMWVNNETGTLQDIQSLAAAAHRHGAVFHTDAVQAMATQAVDVRRLGVDLLTISAHKFYGPKGCGALYCREGISLAAVNSGGQQESYLRGGTENVPAITGLAEAVTLLEKNREKDVAHMQKLKDRLLDMFEEKPGVLVNSPSEFTSPSICNLGFQGMEAEAVVFYLSREGVLISMGAACNTRSVEPSHVIKALHLPEDYLRGCIRISFSGDMTSQDLEFICSSLEKTIERLKRG